VLAAPLGAVVVADPAEVDVVTDEEVADVVAEFVASLDLFA
jgi:hypothetical protein